MGFPPHLKATDGIFVALSTLEQDKLLRVIKAFSLGICHQLLKSVWWLVIRQEACEVGMAWFILLCLLSSGYPQGPCVVWGTLKGRIG